MIHTQENHHKNKSHIEDNFQLNFASFEFIENSLKSQLPKLVTLESKNILDGRSIGRSIGLKVKTKRLWLLFIKSFDMNEDPVTSCLSSP